MWIFLVSVSAQVLVGEFPERGQMPFLIGQILSQRGPAQAPRGYPPSRGYLDPNLRSSIQNPNPAPRRPPPPVTFWSCPGEARELSQARLTPRMTPHSGTVRDSLMTGANSLLRLSLLTPAPPPAPHTLPPSGLPAPAGSASPFKPTPASLPRPAVKKGLRSEATEGQGLEHLEVSGQGLPKV